MHQFVGLQGLVQQDIQTGLSTGQQVLRGSVAAHGDGRDEAGSVAVLSAWRGLPKQFKPHAVGQLEVQEHQVVGALGQKGSSPTQAVGLLDDTARPGVLQDGAGAHAVHGLIVNDEQARGGLCVHGVFRMRGKRDETIEGGW